MRFNCLLEIQVQRNMDALKNGYFFVREFHIKCMFQRQRKQQQKTPAPHLPIHPNKSFSNIDNI